MRPEHIWMREVFSELSLIEFIFVLHSLCLFNWFWVLVKLNQNRMWDLVSFQSQNHWGQIENTTGRNHSLDLLICPLVTYQGKTSKFWIFNAKTHKKYFSAAERDPNSNGKFFKPSKIFNISMRVSNSLDIRNPNSNILLDLKKWSTIM